MAEAYDNPHVNAPPIYTIEIGRGVEESRVADEAWPVVPFYADYDEHLRGQVESACAQLGCDDASRDHLVEMARTMLAV